MDNRNYSQITFEFSEVPAEQENAASVGVRVKSLKTEPEPAKAPEIEEETPVAESVTTPVKKSTRGRKSLKALDAEADLVNIPDDETLFQRQYYSIGEVAEMFGVNQSLLRFWENEFDIIQPRKNRKGDRLFTKENIQQIQIIYNLVKERGFTLEGAKQELKKEWKNKPCKPDNRASKFRFYNFRSSIEWGRWFAGHGITPKLYNYAACVCGL